MLIGLIDHGVSNVDSIYRALEVCGATVKRIKEPDAISGVDKIVLPGVGSFDTEMATLNGIGLTQAICEEVENGGVPILGICLGMQLLLSESEEGDSQKGLNLIPGKVRRIQPEEGERVPHVGWNEIDIQKNSKILSDEMNHKDFYFVHSYCADVDDPAHVLAKTPFANGIQSIIGRDRIYGTQFHPEKSQQYGLQLIKNFVQNG